MVVLFFAAGLCWVLAAGDRLAGWLLGDSADPAGTPGHTAGVAGTAPVDDARAWDRIDRPATPAPHQSGRTSASAVVRAPYRARRLARRS